MPSATPSAAADKMLILPNLSQSAKTLSFRYSKTPQPNSANPGTTFLAGSQIWHQQQGWLTGPTELNIAARPVCAAAEKSLAGGRDICLSRCRRAPHAHCGGETLAL